MSNTIVRRVWPAVESEPIFAPPDAAAILASRCSDEQACTHLGRLISQGSEIAFDREITLRRMTDAQCEIARIDADREIDVARIERRTRIRESRDRLTANIVHAVMASPAFRVRTYVEVVPLLLGPLSKRSPTSRRRVYRVENSP